MNTTRAQKKSHKRLYLAVCIVLTACLVMLLLEATNTTHFFHKSAVVRAPSAPISQLPKQPLTNGGEKAPTDTNGVDQGGATDKNGQVPTTGVSTDPSKWSKSASGVITVKSPIVNSTLTSGGILTGAASVDEVQYRLIDDKVGVIAQGPISVVDGNFTASISFTTHSDTGRLDVFSTEANGREINSVQLLIKF